MQVRLTTPCFASTVYHFPIRIPEMISLSATEAQWNLTFINRNSNVVRDIKLPNIDDVVTRIRYAVISFIIVPFIIKKIKASICTISSQPQ